MALLKAESQPKGRNRNVGPFRWTSEMIKASVGVYKKGYGRILAKIKEICQNFSTAVVNGRRSGSGELLGNVDQHLLRDRFI